jgi:AcrR family transcriptional regulator
MMYERGTSDDILSSTTAIALLEAGIVQFGQYGLKATTRNVAEQASANIAAIPYYFRNKKGLYNACMHYIVDKIWETIGNSVQLFEAIPKDGEGKIPKTDAKACYLQIMDTFCGFFLENPDSLNWAQFIMREHSSPTEAYRIFYDRYYKHVQDIKLHLLCTCLDKPFNDKRIKLQSHALFGQVLGFLVARETLLNGLKQDDLSKEDIALIKDVVRAHALAIIGE